MPSTWQVRSKSTSAGNGRVNLPVNCSPLSVRTSNGTSHWFIVAIQASRRAVPEGFSSTAAIIPEVVIDTRQHLHPRRPARNIPPTRSSCHRCTEPPSPTVCRLVYVAVLAY